MYSSYTYSCLLGKEGYKMQREIKQNVAKPNCDNFVKLIRGLFVNKNLNVETEHSLPHII